MNKGRTAVENSALSKPTWEIMKIIWEKTDFCWELILRAFFRLWKQKTVDNIYQKKSGATLMAASDLMIDIRKI